MLLKFFFNEQEPNFFLFCVVLSRFLSFFLNNIIFLFLMTKSGPIQANISKYWVSTIFNTKSLKNRRGRHC